MINYSFLFEGKHDGSVQGINYFTCKPKHGMFVKVDKLILDKRGRALHNSKSSNFPAPESGSMRRSQSKVEGMSESARQKPVGSGKNYLKF